MRMPQLHILPIPNLQKEALLPVRFSNLVIPEEDDVTPTGTGSTLQAYGRLGCAMHCKACNSRLFRPQDLVWVCLATEAVSLLYGISYMLLCTEHVCN